MITQRLREMGIGFNAGSGNFSEDRPTLVMIHGAGGSTRIWQNQTRILNRSINALAIDLPGHGESPGPARPDIDGYAEWLRDLLREVFDAPPFLMGHSMGGAIVQKVALSAPDLVKVIILVGTGPRLRVAPVFLEGLQNNFDTMIERIMGVAYASGADPRLIRDGTKLMRAAGAAVVYADFDACNRFDVRNDIPRITLPCLILCGNDDQLTPSYLSQKLNESIRGSRMEIVPDAGHMLMIENYPAFNDRVLDFIANSE